MPIPHEKCPLAVAKTRPLLLFMQYRFLDNADAASQVAFFQTQTFLHSIPPPKLQFCVDVEPEDTVSMTWLSKGKIPPPHTGKVHFWKSVMLICGHKSRLSCKKATPQTAAALMCRRFVMLLGLQRGGFLC